MPAATTMVHVRVSDETKSRATRALAAMGLSVSDAVRAMLTRVAAEQQLPFELRVPNAETRAAMAEAEKLQRKRRARFATSRALMDALDKNAKS